MKVLIEYKLWADQIPYFVDDPLGGVYKNGKCYGISKDTDNCYLPDTIKEVTINELLEIVQASELMKSNTDNPIECIPMTSEDKINFLNDWLTMHGIEVNK